MKELLYRDHQLAEAEHNKFPNRIARMLKSVFPRLAYHGSFALRKPICAQLSSRGRDVLEDWHTHPSLSRALDVLRVISEELNLPNNYFFRDDPIKLILESGFPDDDQYLTIALSEKFDIDFSAGQIQKAFAEEWTVEFFVNDVLRHTTNRNTCNGTGFCE